MPRSLRGRAAAVLLALSAASCRTPTAPAPGGEYLGSVDSPYSVEGAGVFDMATAGVEQISSPRRIMVVRAISADTVRVLMINDPTRLIGAPLSFRVRMAAGTPPPGGRMLLAVNGGNDPRYAVDDYVLRFNRVAEPGASPSVAARPGGPAAQITDDMLSLDRMLDMFFPNPPQPLTAAEQASLDGAGNVNRVFDLGDVRFFLFRNRGQIPGETVWAPGS